MPGRIANTRTIGRVPQLQNLAEGYQQSALKDLLSINDCNSGRQGEPLYLPVNFISHLRGNRAEEEEILQTPGGSKLYLSQGGRKVQPEKLTRGPFFGANARILPRMIPNLTHELATYLDYLRKLGDLLINYTASSVYALDNEHRYEIAELGTAWNSIDPTLSLNILKKRESSTGAATKVATGGSGSSSNSTSYRQNSRVSLVICWQFNQKEGCSYQPKCKFQHVCNIVGCGADHPAFKHAFRGAGAQKAITAE